MSVVTDSGEAGPTSAWLTVFCGVDLIARAVGSAVAGWTCGASTTLAATGTAATAGASAVVGCSLGTGAGV
jgi:hypothetical protein